MKTLILGMILTMNVFAGSGDNSVSRSEYPYEISCKQVHSLLSKIQNIVRERAQEPNITNEEERNILANFTLTADCSQGSVKTGKWSSKSVYKIDLESSVPLCHTAIRKKGGRIVSFDSLGPNFEFELTPMVRLPSDRYYAQQLAYILNDNGIVAFTKAGEFGGYYLDAFGLPNCN